jgi:hypothetical protein
MPGKNGYELCETIKQDPNLKHIPVVLLVGAFEPFDQAEARRVRADDHLTKPFEFRALIDTVRKLISAGDRQQTAPLVTRAVVEEETVAPLEPRPTGPLASPALKLDLSAMTEPVEAVSPAADGTDFPAQSFDDSAPLDLDYGTQGEETGFGAVDVELAPEPTGRQTAVFGSPSWAQSVSETIGQMASYQQPEPLDLGAFDFATEESASSPESVSQIEQAAHAEPYQGSSVPSTFTSDSDSIVLDFEKSEMPASPLLDTALAFETEPEAVFEILTDEEDAQPSLEATNDETDTLKTRKLDASVVDMPDWKFEGAGQPELEASASNTVAHPESGLAMAEQSDEPGAELFAVDEPLGDLLSDEGATANAEPQTRALHSEPSYAGFVSTDAFELQFNPVEHEATGQATASAVEQPAAHTIESEQAAQLDEPAGVASEMPFDEEIAVSRSDAPQSIEPVEPPEQYETDHAAVGESRTREGETVETTDWAASAFSHDPASQDDVFAHSETASYSTGPLDEEVAAPVNEQASFTTATMWTAEEARFAPIDIEAVPVEETEAQPPAAETFAVADDERGFDFTSVAAVQPATVEAELPVVEESKPVETVASGSAQGAEPSPAVMDEIVRRVVAQMSDAVVREIAWEVVPDVVERVIERLARESLSKKM